MVLCALLGGVVFYWIGGEMTASNHGDVVSIMFGRSFGVGVGMMAMGGVVAVMMGFCAAVYGDRLYGVLVVAASMGFAGVRGGTIFKWAGYVESGGGYWWFAVDLVLWTAGLIVMMLLMWGVRDRIRNWVRGVETGNVIVKERGKGRRRVDRTGWKRERYWRAGLVLFGAGIICVLQAQVWRDFVVLLICAVVLMAGLWYVMKVVSGDKMSVGIDGLLGGEVAIVLGGVCVLVLMRSEATGQVMGSLVVGFAVAGMAAHQMFARGGVGLILLSPVVLYLAVCCSVGIVHGGEENRELLEAMYHTVGMYEGTRGYMLPLAFGTPVQYVSAGVVGAVVGVLWSKNIMRHHRRGKSEE